MKMKDFELIIFSIALLASYYWLWEKIIDFLQFISSCALVSPKVLQSNKNIVIGWYLLLSTDPYNIQIKDDFAQYLIFHSTLIWWIVSESLEGNYRPMPMYGAILEKKSLKSGSAWILFQILLHGLCPHAILICSKKTWNNEHIIPVNRESSKSIASSLAIALNMICFPQRLPIIII